MKIIPNITLQDGRDYSPAGIEVDVDEDVARDLVDRGFALLAPGAAFKAPRANAKKAASSSGQSLQDAGNQGAEDSDPAGGSQLGDAAQSGVQA